MSKLFKKTYFPAWPLMIDGEVKRSVMSRYCQTITEREKLYIAKLSQVSGHHRVGKQEKSVLESEILSER